MTASTGALEQVKQRSWFYEFALPDGTTTKADIPVEVKAIHTSRLKHLRRIIERKVAKAADMTTIDFSSHEGYFSIELAKHFRSVRGFEIRQESLDAASLISEVLGVSNIEYIQADLQEMEFDPELCADFVLLYGLLYHLEDPIHVLRLASQLCRQHILVETQIFPYDLAGRIEDGSYQRQVEGVLALAPDYPDRREGGSAELALVPSLNALLFLLKQFGFGEVEVLKPEPDDYEQFRRGSRVIVYGRKTEPTRRTGAKAALRKWTSWSRR
jgi:tRNA (mo5U34)-methyltransferase